MGAFCAADNTCKDQHPPDIGQPCSSPSSCASGICGYTQGIADGAPPVPDGNGTPPPQTTGCTVGCSSTPECTPGWMCLQVTVGEGTCVCNWAPEICDSMDNNCDGIVDNEPEADNYCTMMAEGIPQKCVMGACVCDHMCDGSCVDLESDDKNCGKCNHACTTGVEKCVGGSCGCAFTECGTACVNTKGSDNAHCGDCTTTCPYQCAEGTCGPATFASGLKDPGAIMVDATNVYWVDQGTKHAQVEYCPLAGCPGGTPMTLAVSNENSLYQGQLGTLVVTGTNVYFGDDSGSVETSPIVGGTGTASTYSAADTTATYLTTDGTNLYWANQFNQDIEGCGLGTSCASASSLANLIAASIQPEGIAVSGGTLYFGAYAIYASKTSIESVPVGGGAVTTLCTVPGFTSSIKDVLIAGGNLYFTSPTTAVHVCPLATPGVKATAFWTGKSSVGLATDGTDLYWTIEATDGSILKCALGTSCAKATILATHLKAPTGIAVNGTEIYYTSIVGKSVSVFHN
jgi:hypothetical protein